MDNKHAHRLCVYGIIVKRHRLSVLEADPHSTQATCMVEAVTHRQCVYGIINTHTCRGIRLYIYIYIYIYVHDALNTLK